MKNTQIMSHLTIGKPYWVRVEIIHRLFKEGGGILVAVSKELHAEAVNCHTSCDFDYVIFKVRYKISNIIYVYVQTMIYIISILNFNGAQVLIIGDLNCQIMTIWCISQRNFSHLYNLNQLNSIKKNIRLKAFKHYCSIISI